MSKLAFATSSRGRTGRHERGGYSGEVERDERADVLHSMARGVSARRGPAWSGMSVDEDEHA
jgi:hypothetical protein